MTSATDGGQEFRLELEGVTKIYPSVGRNPRRAR
jgi:hypothetical protein